MSIAAPIVFVVGICMMIASIWTISTLIRADSWEKDTLRFQKGYIYGREATPIRIKNIVMTAKYVTLIELVIGLGVLIAGIYVPFTSSWGWLVSIVACIVFTFIATAWFSVWRDIVKNDIPLHLQRSAS